MHLLFRGYNERSDHFSLRSDGGFFQIRQLHDSLAVDFSTFKAFAIVAPGKDGAKPWEIAPEGSGAAVRFAESDCKAFEIKEELFPKQDCAAVEFHLARDTAGALRVERFSLDSLRLPAAGTLRYLGPVQVRKYHVEGDLQDGYLPNDPRPFLVPKRVMTTIETDKGKIIVANEHTMAGKR